MEHSRPSPGHRIARKLIVDLSVMVGIGIVLGLIAPFGSDAMPLVGRVAYWVLLAVAGYCFYNPIGTLIVTLGPGLDLPAWFMWSAAVVLASVPMSILVWFVNHYPGPFRVPGLELALGHYLSVMVIGAVITAIFNLIPQTRPVPGAERQESPERAEPPARKPRFIDRLPPELGSDLIALQMEDHYVRAHTALGSDLVLMRMRDAVAELEDLPGEQVHRSWWVARDAVTGVRREGRNVMLQLDGGLEAPVSRANVPVLKNRGWI